MHNTISSVIEKYKKEIDLVRDNPDLLNNYRFDKNGENTNQFKRLRLNIAIYNDLKESDYEIVKFLFTEEIKLHRIEDISDNEDYELDDFYFSTFLLSLFNNPEKIWTLYEAKSIDFDSMIGLDGEFLFTSGIATTYRFLENAEHPLKKYIYNYYGSSVEECYLSQDHMDKWKKLKQDSYRNYKYPISNELSFLYYTREKSLLIEKLPLWVNSQKTWNEYSIYNYLDYAIYAGDKQMETDARKLLEEKSKKPD